MEMLYCIKCETTEKVHRLFDTVVPVCPLCKAKKEAVQIGFVHEIDDRNWVEPDWCCFEDGWATIPPPVLEENWVDFAQPPSEEELEAINAEAELLLADLEAE